jgi:N-glycosylase/DNA lyase
MDQIMDSGQCFRINKISADSWIVKAFSRSLIIHREGDFDYALECSPEEYEEVWLDYFDMRRDYGKIKELIKATKDPYLAAAVDYGRGIRILKQDLWETIVTFLISQQNNISRIKNTLSKLCEPYGNSFPSPDILLKYSERDFLTLGLGYRAKYLINIVDSVVNGDLNLNNLKSLKYNEAINYLKQFNGIGDKVANCIALFGLRKIEAFPIDVWIRRIIDVQYGGIFDITHFSGYAGVVQQYMFFYQRSLTSAKRNYKKINL